MLGDQFQFLAWFYVNPKKAASKVLDHGQFLFALIAAALVTLAVSTGADLTKRNEYRLTILFRDLMHTMWACQEPCIPELFYLARLGTFYLAAT